MVIKEPGMPQCDSNAILEEDQRIIDEALIELEIRQSQESAKVSALVADALQQEIALILALLSEGQKPLGAVFEAVWDENVDGLYKE